MSGLLTTPLILSLSKDGLKGESPDRAGWFDKLTMSGLFTAPLILSLSKDGLKGESPDRAGWFDKLTMSGLCACHRLGAGPVRMGWPGPGMVNG